MEYTSIIACICEGGAENEILQILLENNKLKFTTEELLEERLIAERSAKNFERRYLNRAFDEQITIIRILDSKNEKFKISKLYERIIFDVIDVITAPEIEILFILSEGKYTEFKKSKLKPSDYCKTKLFKNKKVKSPDFVRNYYSDVDKLIYAIEEYARINKQEKGNYNLKDLLK